MTVEAPSKNRKSVPPVHRRLRVAEDQVTGSDVVGEFGREFIDIGTSHVNVKRPFGLELASIMQNTVGS